jgi:hypothetical protein
MCAPSFIFIHSALSKSGGSFCFYRESIAFAFQAAPAICQPSAPASNVIAQRGFQTAKKVDWCFQTVKVKNTKL